MKNKILRELRPFRVPIIILGVFLLALLVLAVVMPAVNSAVADTTPIVSISASNDTVYKKGDKINAEDFDIKAKHENGKESSLSADAVKLSSTKLSPVGKNTVVTLTLAEDESIKCECKVSVERKKVVGFQIGYPEVSNVTAVLYSNGELCFEGEGDVLVCNEGEYPWFEYEGMEENPITSVSFENGVTPTDMNYWFEGLQTLTYVDTIPSSVKTMVRTFSSCIALEQPADWSECENLLNINEVYAGCTELESACAILPETRSAYRAFAECGNLLSAADSSKAEALVNAQEMYAQCTNLVEAEIAPNAVNLNGIFKDCINLKNMPEIPDTASDLTSAFENDVSLQNLTSVPSGAEKLTNMFYNCQLIHGELTIDCDTRDFDGIFTDACLATKVNLVGASKLLDVYANTNEDGNVYVNGKSADKALTSYDQVFPYDMEDETAATLEEDYVDNVTPSGTERNVEGSGGDTAETDIAETEGATGEDTANQESEQQNAE